MTKKRVSKKRRKDDCALDELFVGNCSKEYIDSLPHGAEEMVHHPVAYRCGGNVEQMLMYEQMVAPLREKIQEVDNHNNVDMKEFLEMDSTNVN